MNVLIVGGNLIGGGGIIDAMGRLYHAETGGSLDIEAVIVCRSLEEHWRCLSPGGTLRHRRWEAAIFQEKNAVPAEEPERCAESLAKWRQFASEHGARPFLLEPWRRKEHFGDDEAYRGFAAAYAALSARAAVPLIPVGQAWEQLPSAGRDALYQSTGNHASPRGAEIAAAVILNTVFPAQCSLPLPRSLHPPD